MSAVPLVLLGTSAVLVVLCWRDRPARVLVPALVACLLAVQAVDVLAAHGVSPFADRLGPALGTGSRGLAAYAGSVRVPAALLLLGLLSRPRGRRRGGTRPRVAAAAPGPGHRGRAGRRRPRRPVLARARVARRGPGAGLVAGGRRARAHRAPARAPRPGHDDGHRGRRRPRGARGLRPAPRRAVVRPGRGGDRGVQRGRRAARRHRADARRRCWGWPATSWSWTTAAPTAPRRRCAGRRRTPCCCPVNRGQGAALRLGYRLALEHGADYIITTDADGQYDVADFPVVLAPLLEGRADFVTGSRVLGHQHTQDRVRRLGVHVFAWLASALVGRRLTDTSFGLRAMRAEVPAALTLLQPQYQSSELLLGALSRGFRVVEVPGTMHVRTAGTTKKGRNLVYGSRYARVVLGTWWREGCPRPVTEARATRDARPVSAASRGAGRAGLWRTERPFLVALAPRRASCASWSRSPSRPPSSTATVRRTSSWSTSLAPSPDRPVGYGVLLRALSWLTRSVERRRGDPAPARPADRGRALRPAAPLGAPVVAGHPGHPAAAARRDAAAPRALGAQRRALRPARRPGRRGARLARPPADGRHRPGRPAARRRHARADRRGADGARGRAVLPARGGDLARAAAAVPGRRGRVRAPARGLRRLVPPGGGLLGPHPGRRPRALHAHDQLRRLPHVRRARRTSGACARPSRSASASTPPSTAGTDRTAAHSPCRPGTTPDQALRDFALRAIRAQPLAYARSSPATSSSASPRPGSTTTSTAPPTSGPSPATSTSCPKGPGPRPRTRRTAARSCARRHPWADVVAGYGRVVYLPGPLTPRAGARRPRRRWRGGGPPAPPRPGRWRCSCSRWAWAWCWCPT